MKEFEKFIEDNRAAAYAAARANAKHKNGHATLPRDDPWMLEDSDKLWAIAEANTHYNEN